MRALILCLTVAAVAFGQEFEVVSVKPNKSATNNSHMHTDQGLLTATNVTLRSLVVMAYGIKDYQLEAPAWLSDERYDVSAKFPEALPTNPRAYDLALNSMVRKMLADRFQLRTHNGTKPFEVYDLVVAKGGLKAKEVPDGGNHDSSSNNNHYTGKCVRMSQFVQFLARRVDLPVFDQTNLKGFYDMKLDWAPDQRPPSDAGTTSELPAGPTLMMALEDQLGLKLELHKAPLEIVVVDHVERFPTEN